MFFNSNEGTLIRTQTEGGSIGTVATLGQSAQVFSYRHDATNHVIYYCCTASTGALRKYDVATSTDTALSRPISRMACSGRGMYYSSSRNSVVFIFKQDGLGGIAEHLNP